MDDKIRLTHPLPVDPAAIEAVSAVLAHHYRFVPLGWEDGALKIAVARPLSIGERDELRVILGRRVLPLAAAPEAVEAALREYYGLGAEILETLAGDPVSERPVSSLQEAPVEGDGEASISRFLNKLLADAYRGRATDIHLEPYEDDLRARTRIDGVLYDVHITEPLKPFQSALTSRVKILAGLNISEKRLPQDGRFKTTVEGTELEARVSTLPTPFGESIGIRLLTRPAFLDLERLGFAADDLSTLAAQLAKPHGVLFLTGPTGSGKTTTLYAFLKRLNAPERKIITIEDPVEYQMRGITQVQVHPAIGLTFAHGLRSMLRHDPDVMMVGEVRDLETAEIAIRVALTGHLVFSTLHTNDAAGAVTRLQDIGLEPYLISSSVRCFIAQRLVRVLCDACKAPARVTPEIRAEFALAEGINPTLFAARGCEACKGTGFSGRTVIYEILPVTEGISEAIVQRLPARLLRERAVAQGMKTLRQCGWEKIMAGVTTPEEVLRATLEETL